MHARRRVRLIEPQGRPGRPFNAWITRWPLLGPILLATILKQRGYDAAVYNENVSGPLPENPQAYRDVHSADVVGISIMTPTANRGYALADRLRRDGSRATIVFGGVHATFLPEEALDHGDVVVRGEGETVIQAVADGDVRGVIDAPPLEDLDSVPAPDHWVMRDFDRLLERSGRRERYELPVMTSRGCPYGCTYCSVARMFGRRIRRQSVEKVRDDVLRHVGRGFRRLFFYDDNFTADRARTRGVLEDLAPLHLRFNAQVRADFHWLDAARARRDDDLLDLMRRAGGDVLYVGYETVEDATAREWRKGYAGTGSLEQRLREDTRILHENGFWIHAMFVLGPQHTAAGARRIVRFARACGIETMQVSVLTPFPGTVLFEQVRPHLLFTDFPGDWDYYDGAHCVYTHSRLRVEGLQRAVLNAHRRFYRWGGWSLRRLSALMRQPIPLRERLKELWSNARTARATLRQWRRESRAFLDVARARLARLLPQVRLRAGR